jgi:hypothetical protein
MFIVSMQDSMGRTILFDYNKAVRLTAKRMQEMRRMQSRVKKFKASLESIFRRAK